MKILFLQILLFATLQTVAQKQNDLFSKVKFYYSDGSVKEVRTKNIDSIRNIKLVPGNLVSLDSLKTFKNGKLNGPKRYFYPEGAMYCTEYMNGKLIAELGIDANHKTRLQFPLDIKKVETCTVKLKSGRDYFDKSKTDTIIIINNSLPPLNRTVSVTGAMIAFLDDDSYAIRLAKPDANPKEIKITVTIYCDLGYYKPACRNDTIMFPVK